MNLFNEHALSQNESSTPKSIRNKDKEELLTILLDVGDGVEKPITIYCDDDPKDIVDNFIKVHNLPDKIKEKLEVYIKENIEQVMIEIGLEKDESLMSKNDSKITDKVQNRMNIMRSTNLVPRRITDENSLTSLSVHQRLHMQAMNKQKAIRHTKALCN